MSGVQTITIGADEGDQRIDRWLKKRFPQLTQGAVEKMCRTGQLRVDGGRVKANTRIETGQEVRVPPLPDAAAPVPARAKKPAVKQSDAEMIQSAVLWRDEHIIALNKPPGLPSQGGSGQGDRHVDGLTEALMFGYKDRPKLVHRLDKDTSGVLLLARTDRIARALSEAFRHRLTRKIYWAAVAGVPHPRMGSIKYGLVKAPGRGRMGEGEKMVAVHPGEVADPEGGAGGDEAEDAPRRGPRNPGEGVGRAAGQLERVIGDPDQSLQRRVGAAQQRPQVVVLPEEGVEAAAHRALAVPGRPGPDPAAQLGLCLQQGDRHTAFSQPGGSREPRDAATDHHYPGTPLAGTTGGRRIDPDCPGVPARSPRLHDSALNSRRPRTSQRITPAVISANPKPKSSIGMSQGNLIRENCSGW